MCFFPLLTIYKIVSFFRSSRTCWWHYLLRCDGFLRKCQKKVRNSIINTCNKMCELWFPLYWKVLSHILLGLLGVHCACVCLSYKFARSVLRRVYFAIFELAMCIEHDTILSIYLFIDRCLYSWNLFVHKCFAASYTHTYV